MTPGQRTKPDQGGTRRRILDHARRAFNERGVSAVGPRDIARELELSPGNVSYHFPTKEDLILALIDEVHAANNAAAAGTRGAVDFAAVDEVLRAIMRRDLDGRWLMRDAVGLLHSLPALRPVQARMHRAREARVDALVARLVEGGMLEPEAVERALPRLRLQLLTQVFFWLPAATLAAPGSDPARQLDEHARAALGLFLPFCTRAGRRQLEVLLDAPATAR